MKKRIIMALILVGTVGLGNGYGQNMPDMTMQDVCDELKEMKQQMAEEEDPAARQMFQQQMKILESQCTGRPVNQKAVKQDCNRLEDIMRQQAREADPQVRQMLEMQIQQLREQCAKAAIIRHTPPPPPASKDIRVDEYRLFLTEDYAMDFADPSWELHDTHLLEGDVTLLVRSNRVGVDGTAKIRYKSARGYAIFKEPEYCEARWDATGQTSPAVVSANLEDGPNNQNAVSVMLTNYESNGVTSTAHVKCPRASLTDISRTTDSIIINNIPLYDGASAQDNQSGYNAKKIVTARLKKIRTYYEKR